MYRHNHAVWQVILECYHPSAKYTEPYSYCGYFGTPALSDEMEGQGSIYDIADHQAAKEEILRRLYYHFHLPGKTRALLLEMTWSVDGELHMELQ